MALGHISRVTSMRLTYNRPHPIISGNPCVSKDFTHLLWSMKPSEQCLLETTLSSPAEAFWRQLTSSCVGRWHPVKCGVNRISCSWSSAINTGKKSAQRKIGRTNEKRIKKRNELEFEKVCRL